MKKFFSFLCFIFLAASVCSAQDYKKFRVGLGFGYGVPSGNGSKAGVFFTLEPSYRLKDNLSLGLRFESALLARGYSGSTDGGTFDVAAIGSTTINGQYYFNNNRFRPFVGLGLGVYSMTGISTSLDLGTGSPTNLSLAAAETKFGFYPRVGFDLGHFTMLLDYNIVGSTKVDPQLGGGDFKNNYLGIRLGFFLGGGKK